MHSTSWSCAEFVLWLSYCWIIALDRIRSDVPIASPGPTAAGVRYDRFVKKLDLPSGFEALTRLTYDDVIAAALTRAYLTDD